MAGGEFKANAWSLPAPREEIKVRYLDIKALGEQVEGATEVVARLTPLVASSTLAMQAQVHDLMVGDTAADSKEEPLVRSKPIAIPRKEVKAEGAAWGKSTQSVKHVSVENSKHSYVIGRDNVYPAYTFGPCKMNHLTLTRAHNVAVSLDSAISGVDVLNCKNITVILKNATHCNVEESENVIFVGPAVVEGSHSINIILNGETLPVTVFTENKRHKLSVGGLLRRPLPSIAEASPGST
ncbi:Hypothetical protein POVN_LOCUS359 [uncultured virus]|nr:Hypothetical protein POVN_LOCUS359 [uncultured virus]